MRNFVIMTSVWCRHYHGRDTGDMSGVMVMVAIFIKITLFATP